MATVIQEINNCNEVICGNIDSFNDNRGLLSQNVINSLRNLVNQVSLLAYTRDENTDSNWDNLQAGMKFMRKTSHLSFLRIFYDQLEVSASHYSLDANGAERVMLKYYEALILVQAYLRANFNINILDNLKDFPVDTDSSHQKYYESIADEINDLAEPDEGLVKGNYYIHRVKPFFVHGSVYYEVSFSAAIDRDNKFSRRIGFSKNRVFENYATDLWLAKSQITVDGIEVPVELIGRWRTNIRPCEFNNIGKIIGFQTKADRNQKDYLPIMDFISNYQMSLVEIISLDDNAFNAFVRRVKPAEHKSTIIDLIQTIRVFCKNGNVGSRVIRYLLLGMKNSSIKEQWPSGIDDRLTGVYLSKKTFPFDKMPFCTSLKNHNPRLQDVLMAIPITDREHELVARKILTNTEQQGILYTEKSHFPEPDQVDELVDRYNRSLYTGHIARRIEKYDDHYFIRGYEEDVKQIITDLKSFSGKGILNHEANVSNWVSEQDRGIDDTAKQDILKKLFDTSKVAVIYGAAGTGKTRMIEHISSYFSVETKIYLANTKTAVSNLETRLEGSGDFMTVAKATRTHGLKCSVLFIDECSTVSNKDMVAVLKNVEFDLLVLVGDVYQIQSIRFGNWFNMIRKFLPKQAVFELKVPFRTKDNNLIGLWSATRSDDVVIEEIMARQGYARRLDKTIFDNLSGEEIILCLNYDGLYGVNNINKLLQSKNKGLAAVWDDSLYKVGDPIVFSESDAYGQVLFNSLKGRIASINLINKASIEFTLEIIGTNISAYDAHRAGLTLVGTNIVKMKIEKRHNNDNDDSYEDIRSVVPFQVAYAVTVHKAQGLEYESVKIVVTKDSEEQVTKNIFYTAITRATKKLSIYWSPEIQHRIIASFAESNTDNDVKVFLSRNHELLK